MRSISNTISLYILASFHFLRDLKINRVESLIFGEKYRGVCMSAEKLMKGYKNEDIVYIGRKSVMSYVLAAVTQFNTDDSNKVVLKARGMSISKAVDE
jgi:hypothetical protein